MTSWDSQHYRIQAQKNNISQEVIAATIETGKRVVKSNSSLVPVFTLRHLAYLADADFQFLRHVVERKEVDPYDTFRIKKNGKENTESFRIICVPDYRLMRVQKWIVDNILNYTRTHEASFAFTKGKNIKGAATLHCGCKWMIKMDVRRFFESISEIAVYRVFRNLGYEPLISFEMTRLCTRLGTYTKARRRKQWRSNAYQQEIHTYFNCKIGHLPQPLPLRRAVKYRWCWGSAW
ncbi:MAG: hypothetical protein COA84_07030 [Robiginitomaculum sp.]|nr:MAG: hypothetical protein COA84_07030 [Robiginitomaculum sp.]